MDAPKLDYVEVLVEPFAELLVEPFVVVFGNVGDEGKAEGGGCGVSDRGDEGESWELGVERNGGGDEERL